MVNIKEIIRIDADKKIIYCLFSNNEVRYVDLTKIIEEYPKSKMINRLRNKKFFGEVKLDTYGTLVWPNELDFCPDVLFAWSKPFDKDETPFSLARILS
ncbi:MAG: DUF2442 domain-containing protein [Saprospiraceae bacterium]|jgi:hypothetical protein|nr:DUF2442 domain-containing protein [Saprospiraceae bacterium]